MKFSTVIPFALYALATAEEESTEFLTSFVTKYFTVSTTISLNSTTVTLHTPAAVTFLDCLNQSSSANYTTSPTPSAESPLPLPHPSLVLLLPRRPRRLSNSPRRTVPPLAASQSAPSLPVSPLHS